MLFLRQTGIAAGEGHGDVVGGVNANLFDGAKGRKLVSLVSSVPPLKGNIPKARGAETAPH